jgi:hypothetical protein
MRIINIVELKNGTVNKILSFPIYEEQLSQDVVEDCEDTFRKILNEITDLTDEDIDTHIEDGRYQSNDGYEFCIVWSDTE